MAAGICPMHGPVVKTSVAELVRQYRGDRLCMPLGWNPSRHRMRFPCVLRHVRQVSPVSLFSREAFSVCSPASLYMYPYAGCDLPLSWRPTVCSAESGSRPK